MTRVVVVGGGIAGLAAARVLAIDGVDVTLIESTEQVGGKLRISDVAGIPVDEGAEMFLRRVPEALDLVAALGRADELVSPRTIPQRVWARGSLRPMPARHGHGRAERSRARFAACCPRPRSQGRA